MLLNEVEFRKLSEQYAQASKVLLDAGFYTAAHHLAVVAAECALKAAISSKTRAGDYPPKNINDYYSHDINKLLKLVALKDKAEAEFASRSKTGANIHTVSQFNIEDRYNSGVGKETATSMVIAVIDQQEGFIKWLTTV